ncbi:alpha-L-rhamnosidase-related protein [Salmonirosea aquatica]
MKHITLLTLLWAACLTLVRAQSTTEYNPELETAWDANWITHPAIKGDEFGIYLFKKTFQVNEKPGSFIVHVSADNRYKLYVNGKYITNGPARGDQLHWRFESLDIGPYLAQGSNIVSAVVWNFAQYRPVAQHSVRTGFILQGNTARERIINTDSTWKVLKSEAYRPLPVRLNAYYVVGPGEAFDGGAYAWDWEAKGAADTGFVAAKSLGPGNPAKGLGKYGIVPPHVLVRRTIPLMEEHLQRFKAVRRSSKDIDEGFIGGSTALTIAPNTQLTILLDQGQLTNAYPLLTFSQGQGSTIKLTYAESLVDAEGRKGNRDVVENKKIVGNSNVIKPDGGKNRTYETLWWRTFRYVQLDIETKNEPLVLNDFQSRYTGYPFEEKAVFETQVPTLDQIWDVSWRTQLLCSGENYFDCPYYEQLQYTGDTRIQCLISTYVSGDTRLYKNALQSFHDSFNSIGLTQSRYPSYDPQYIPTFSLVWITMLHDYLKLRKDDGTVAGMMPAVLSVLDWYEKRLDANDLLGNMEWWMFVDWVDAWDSGIPPGVGSTQSTTISLQYVYTLQKAVELMRRYGYPEQAKHYDQVAKRIQGAVNKLSWDAQRGLYADTPSGKNFSQHTNIFALLSGTSSAERSAALMDKVIQGTDMAPASYYFSFYLMEALRKTNKEDQYLELLGPWEDMLKKGLTTFAERADPTRSDCHAWSASPMYFFLSMVCGIEPAGPGFEKVTVAPHLGKLPSVKGAVPHPNGMIEVSLKRKGKSGVEGTVQLPASLTGTFRWGQQTLNLKGGANSISI